MYGREARSALYQWQRRLQTRLGNALLLWMGRRLHGIPERAGQRLGSVIGTSGRWLSPRHYRIVRANLRLAFGREKSEAELAAIAASCYRHLGKCLAEFIRLPAMSPEDIRRVTRLCGSEYLDRGLEQGNGVILLTGHLGNWEMVGARIAADGYPLNVIARAQRDQELTEYIRRTREEAGLRVFHREEAVRQSLRALRRNQMVGILLDQNAGDDGVFVEFFGHLASTFAGAALFALRTDCAVLPTFGWRNRDDTHTIVIDQPVPLVRTGDRDQDIVANTQNFTRIIEGRIRLHPGQWLWLHKRWKSRPPHQKRA
jgi:KDO2-lipid IV(A) lauroyltransferase